MGKKKRTNDTVLVQLEESNVIRNRGLMWVTSANANGHKNGPFWRISGRLSPSLPKEQRPLSREEAQLEAGPNLK